MQILSYGPVESDIERKVCGDAKKIGILNIKIKGNGQSGWPDRLFFIPGGKPFLIEFKRPGEEPRPLQEHIHQLLRALGYRVETYDDATRALQALTAALDSEKLHEKGGKVPSRKRRGRVASRPRDE